MSATDSAEPKVIIFRSLVELPCHVGRARVTRELIDTLFVHHPSLLVESAAPASLEELALVHNYDYLIFMRNTETRERENIHRKRPRSDGVTATDSQNAIATGDLELRSGVRWYQNRTTNAKYGLVGDSSPWDGFWDSSCIIAGNSMAAANAVLSEKCPVAIHWEGGRHHAKYSSAEGFCFVNDVALVAKMLSRHGRVLVVDIDAHHGNGTVELCFADPNIFCFSIHAYGTGIYPGTGALRETSASRRILNVTLPPGSDNDTALPLFSSALSACLARFAPERLVVVCGCDAVQGDELGHLNLTISGLCEELSMCLRLRLPTVLLGGGGYNIPTVARCFSVMTYASLHNGSLPSGMESSVPLSCPALSLFAPGFNLFDCPPLRYPHLRQVSADARKSALRLLDDVRESLRHFLECSESVFSESSSAESEKTPSDEFHNAVFESLLGE